MIARTTIKQLLSLALLLMVSLASAQYDCKEYEKFNCAPSSDKAYKRNGQSRSAMIQVGVPTEMNLIVYRGQDYRVTVCADQQILGDVSFRLVELKRQLKKATILGRDSSMLADEEGNTSGSMRETRLANVQLANDYETVRKVLYDNTEDGMNQTLEFSSTATKRIVLEMVAPGSDSPKRLKNPDAANIACVGILVEHMPTPDLGF